MAKKESTWKRLKRIQSFEYDGHWGAVETSDIDINITKTEDIIEQMDKESAIEIVKIMSNTLKHLFPMISYCTYSSGLCTTDYKRPEEDRNAMWPSCSEASYTTYTAKRMVWNDEKNKKVEEEYRLSEPHLLIAKAIDVLGGDCDCY